MKTSIMRPPVKREIVERIYVPLGANELTTPIIDAYIDAGYSYQGYVKVGVDPDRYQLMFVHTIETVGEPEGGES